MMLTMMQFRKSLLPFLLAMLVSYASGLASVFIGKSKFDSIKATLPDSFSPVPAGGWNAVYQLSVNPKQELVDMLVDGVVHGQPQPADAGKIDVLVNLLQAQGHGFDSAIVDGDWVMMMNRSAKKSPKFQKLVQKTEKLNRAFANFNTSEMKFENINYTPRRNGSLQATVQYKPVASGFSTSPDGKIVLRRIMCDIVNAKFQYRRLKIPLPLRKKGGSLDFLYLDNDMRITRGNRGGLFIHFRPDFLDQFLENA